MSDWNQRIRDAAEQAARHVQAVRAYVIQRLDFESGQATLRPGVLVSVCTAGKLYPLFFLHLRSSPDAKGFGLRDDMLKRALDFRKALNKTAGRTGKVNYIFMGDLNTMGPDYAYKTHHIPAVAEINELDRRTGYRQMRILTKNAPHTSWNGSKSKYAPSNLDHVVAANHPKFEQLGGAEVGVRGWSPLPTDAEKDAWIKKYSDHALLYFELQAV